MQGALGSVMHSSGNILLHVQFCIGKKTIYGMKLSVGSVFNFFESFPQKN